LESRRKKTEKNDKAAWFMLQQESLGNGRTGFDENVSRVRLKRIGNFFYRRGKAAKTCTADTKGECSKAGNGSGKVAVYGTYRNRNSTWEAKSKALKCAVVLVSNVSLRQGLCKRESQKKRESSKGL